MILALVTVSFMGINYVSAKEVDIDTLDANTYIIGERVYELNEHKLSMFDIVNAQAEYSEKYHKVAPILYVGVDLISGETYIRVTTGANSSSNYN